MIRIAHTSETDSHSAVERIAEQFGTASPRVLICFASTRQNPGELARSIRARWPDTVLWGGTTAGEICSGRMGKGSVVAMSLDGDVVSRAGTALVRITPKGFELDEALKSLQAHMLAPLEQLDPNQHVGLVVTDGLSGAEEKHIEALAERTEIPFLGGSAGDDLKFEATHVFQGSQATSSAAALLLMKLPKGYEIAKTQSFKSLGRRLVATSVNAATRTIHAFDGRPAAFAYAEAVGAMPNAIEKSFAEHPLARMVGEEPFIRSPRNLDGTSIRFYCAVEEGETLEVMTATDIITDTAETLRRILSSSSPRGVVDFHCILRALELESRGETQAYADLYKGVPAIGFCTYGEAFGAHVNQTSTILAFR